MTLQIFNPLLGRGIQQLHTPKAIEGIGEIGIGLPVVVWTVVSLGATHANKPVLINIVSTSGSGRIVGARPIGSSLVPFERVRTFNTTSFIVQADGNGDIELYQNGTGPRFFHRATLV